MKNNLLNTAKAFAAYSVVFIHCRFPSDLGSAVESVARFAVPLFFIISGYYCYNSNPYIVQAKLPQKIRHIAYLTLFTNAVYFIWNLILSINQNNTHSWMSSFCSIKTVVNLLCFNVSPFSAHLWFLSALLYCYLLFALINKYRLYAVAYAAIPLLLGSHLMLGELSSVTGLSISTYYIRNFLFLGMPFFLLGNYIHHKEKYILAIYHDVIGIVGIIGGTVLTLVEKDINGKNELFIGSIITVICLFLYIIKNGDASNDTLMMNIGETCSLGIYIMHPIIIDLSKKLAPVIGLKGHKPYYYIRPLVICLFATILAYAWYLWNPKAKISALINNTSKDITSE